MRKALLAALIACCAMFCMTGIAHAEEKYTCASVPEKVTGNLNIEESGACTIKHPVEAADMIIKAKGAVKVEGTLKATSSIEVTSESTLKADEIVAGGNIQLRATSTLTDEDKLKAGSSVELESESNIKVEEIITNTENRGGNLLVTATGEVGTGPIDVEGTNTGGIIEINAEQGGGSKVFTIGGTKQSNGVNGKITDTHTRTGEESALDVYGDLLYIGNGTSSSTGGITLESPEAINTSNTEDAAGPIILQAQKGTLKVSSGHLSDNGTGAHRAGFMLLLAHEVSAPSGAVITANQEPTAPASAHPIIIAAEKVSYGGTGLELGANGAGYEAYNGGSVQLIPQGAVVTSFSTNILEYIEFSSKFEKVTGNLSVSGTGKLTITANGNNDRVLVEGNELTFGSTGTSATTVSANGIGDRVEVYAAGFESSPFTVSKMTLNEGPMTLKSNGPEGSESGEGGKVYIESATMAVKSSSFSATANGSLGGAGNEVYIYATEASTFPEKITGTISANGGTKGNGGYVYFYPGKTSFGIGNSSGYLTFSSTGGSTEGNGGTMYIEPNGKVTVNGSSGIDLSATGKGNGGNLHMYANELAFSGTSTKVAANAKGTGKGGTLSIASYDTPLNIGSESGDVALEAKGAGSGQGGEIEAIGFAGLNATSANITTTAGTTGSGGSIYLGGAVKINGNLSANAGSSGKGNGGTIQVNGKLPYGWETTGGIETSGSNTTLSAIGYGTGKGGSVILNSTSTLSVGTGKPEFALKAISEGTGTGGTVEMSGSEVKLNGGSINVDSVKGTAGAIKVEKTKTLKMAPDTELKADGTEDGNGGEISLIAESIEFEKEEAKIVANGAGTGHGGSIVLESSEANPISISENISLDTEGGDEGQGGEVSVPYSGEYDVEEVIDVDSYDGNDPALGPPAAAFKKGGVVELLKHQKCQQWYVEGGVNAWPHYFFDCAHPMALTAPDEAPAELVAEDKNLSRDINELFPAKPGGGPSDSTTEMWVFENPAQANKIFPLLQVKPAPLSDGAITLQGENKKQKTPYNYVLNFEKFEPPWAAEQPISVVQMKDNTAHELGHVLDHNSGYTWSKNAAFTGTYIPDDQKQLNEDSGLGKFDHGAGKNIPCSTKDEAPFDGQTGFTGSVINDLTNKPICNEKTGKINSGTGNTNSEIDEHAATGIWQENPEQEVFAEAFGWDAYGGELANPLYGKGFSTSSYFQQTTDGLFANGYFGCSLAWAKDALTGTLTLPVYCK